MWPKKPINSSEYEPGLVSVLIASYNHEKYVQETIQSIIDQSYESIELLVMDDGSTDSTWNNILEMKEKCETRFKRVVFQSQKNSGSCCEPFNKLLKISRGEFLLLIASDDILLPDSINTQVLFLDKNKNSAAVFGDMIFMDENSKDLYVDENYSPVSEESKRSFLRYTEFINFVRQDNIYASSNFGKYNTLIKSNYMPIGGLYRKKFFYFSFSKFVGLDDWYLYLQLSKYYNMNYIDIPLIRYRRHSQNLSASSRLKKMVLKMFIFECVTWNMKYPILGFFIWGGVFLKKIYYSLNKK